jgi:hypothetical protein
MPIGMRRFTQSPHCWTYRAGRSAFPSRRKSVRLLNFARSVIVVQHDDDGTVPSAQRFRCDQLMATTTDFAVTKEWMANPN